MVSRHQILHGIIAADIILFVKKISYSHCRAVDSRLHQVVIVLRIALCGFDRTPAIFYSTL